MDELEPTEVVLALEEQFQFSISDDDCLCLATVADVIRYLNERVHTMAA
jgi:acyl carrier protein